MEHKPKLLVAEDEDSLRNLYAGVLLENYDLRLFDNGRDAAEYYQSNISSVDGLITDLQMPELTGDKLIQFIRVREAIMQTPRTPIVLVTGDHIVDINRIDYDRIIFKPFDINYFRDSIDDIMGGYSG